MRKKYLPINQAHINLANAIADLIEHPDCEPVIYNDLLKLTEDWDNRFSDVIDPAEEARRIRKNLPKHFKRLIQRENED